MPATYEPIASATTSSSASTVTFDNIPSTYTDLVVVVAFGSASNVVADITINNDTGTNYSLTRLTGNGTTAASARTTNNSSVLFINGVAVPTTATCIVVGHFMSYANTNVFKTILMSTANAASAVAARVHLWRSTSAITKLHFATGSTFTDGSTFSLYGIKAA